ncbi:MAG: FtsX-like permease family protein [Methanomassiliicoccales archaeon]
MVAEWGERLSRSFFFATLPGISVILISFLFLQTFVALLLTIVIITAMIMLDAMRHRLLITMAIRYVVRRRWTTALVVGGLMVGTAIISTSLVVGDTLDNMIVKQTTESLGEVDFGIGAPFDGYTYFDASFLGNVRDQIAAINQVESSHMLIRDDVAVLNNESGLFNPSFALMALNDTVVKEFGSFLKQDGSILDQAPKAGAVYLNSRAAQDIDARVGDTLIIYISETQRIVAVVSEVVEERALGAFGSANTVYMDIESAQSLLDRPGQFNFIFVSLQGRGDEGLVYASDVRVHIETILQPWQQSNGLRIVEDKANAIEDAKRAAEMFSSLFFVFGSFSIIAGVALVVNIFTMLSEERKGEMGVARAIGMSRSHLRRLFTYEGVIYAALAAAVGSGLGLILAYVITWVMSRTIRIGEFSFDLVKYFTFTPMSLVLGYLAGFLLTVLTVYLATRRISNLNIVRAIRNIPEPPVPRDDSRVFRLGWLILFLGAGLMSLGIWQRSLALASSGLSLMTISLGFLLRRVVKERLAWSLAGLLTILVWAPLPFGIKIFHYEAEIEGYVVAGLFLVSGALLVIMFNSDSLIMIITKLFRVRKEYRAVLKTAISYPLKAKFKTALSVFIFGLVIFTVTTLSVVSGLMSFNIDRLVNETSGGFDVIAFTSTSPILNDPRERLSQELSPLQAKNVSALVALPSSIITLNYSYLEPSTQTLTFKERRYQLIGFNEDLYTLGNYPLSDYDKKNFSNELQVWQAVRNNRSLVIFDGSLRPQSGISGGFGPPNAEQEPGIKIGERVMLLDPLGTPHVVTVAGFMKQSSFRGAFMSEEVVRSEFFAVGYSIMLLRFQDGLDIGKQAALLEKSFIPNGLQTIDVKALAREITGLINSVFTLFEAFLAMGLIVGISGLGIMTIRSIHERRIEIGMMRAIGYRKRMVVANFAIESALISLLGILIGVALGILVGYELWMTSLRSEGFVWIIDIWPILTVAVISFVATILSVYPAARGASRVSPAEVLRFE